MQTRFLHVTAEKIRDARKPKHHLKDVEPGTHGACLLPRAGSPQPTQEQLHLGTDGLNSRKRSCTRLGCRGAVSLGLT